MSTAEVERSPGHDDVTAWHGLQTKEVLDRLDVDASSGLSSDESRSRLDEHGPNRLPEEAAESALVRFIKQFHNVLIYILIAAAFFTAYIGEWIDTGVIVAVVLANAIIGFVQEGKAERALEEIRGMLSLEATVLRGGRRSTVAAEELVPGRHCAAGEWRPRAGRPARAGRAGSTSRGSRTDRRVGAGGQDRGSRRG
jgi:magnesium-transporting ATPase (P-type)